MRLMDRLLLLAESIRDRLWWFSDDHHLTTDPACTQHRAPRPGSRLDRASRGVSCGVCMRRAAFSDVCWWPGCTSFSGHEGAHHEPETSDSRAE